MRSHIINLTKPKHVPKKSHEQIAQDVAAYLDRGGEIEVLPGFTYQPIPRASYSHGEGTRSGV